MKPKQIHVITKLTMLIKSSADMVSRPSCVKSSDEAFVHEGNIALKELKKHLGGLTAYRIGSTKHIILESCFFCNN